MRDTLDGRFAGRYLCPESGRISGFVEIPRRRVRCLACGRLVRIVPTTHESIVGRHYAYAGEPKQTPRQR
jgi:hypothetical protein